MLKRIHVNQHNIKHNRKTGDNKPVFSVKTYKSNVLGHEVAIGGNSKVVYRPDAPLSCGAVAWIETKAPVFVHNEETDHKEIIS